MKVTALGLNVMDVNLNGFNSDRRRRVAINESPISLQSTHLKKQSYFQNVGSEGAPEWLSVPTKLQLQSVAPWLRPMDAQIF